MTLGLMYFARVSDVTVAFNPAIHAVEDLEIFEARVSHARGECAIVTLDCRYPEGGLFAGPMSGILSIEHNGVLKEIARGTITGFPIALAGQTVSVELMCRKPDHVEAVDELYETRDAEVPVELVDESVERRAQSYILDDVYHDRRTLIPTFDPIAGSATPALTIYGEGAAAGQSQIIGMDISINTTPVSKVTVNLEVAFEEMAWGQVDLGRQFDTVSPDDQATYTPEDLRSSIQKISLDGGYELLGATMETTELAEKITVFTTARDVDPQSCVVTPAETVDLHKYRIDDIVIDCAVRATQPRREILTVSVETGIGQYSGRTEKIEETLYMSEGEKRARSLRMLSYKTGRYTMRQIARRGVSPSVFYSGGRIRESCMDIVDAVARYAARIAVERAHCVWLRIDIPATHILDLDLRDRVRVYDARLPGGMVTGKVIGWDIQIGASTPGQLVLACPISTGTGNAVTMSTSSVDIEGDVSIASTTAIDAVKNDDSMALVTKFAMIDAASAQAVELSASTETSPIEDPENAVSKTGIEVEFLDLTPVDYDAMSPTEIELVPFELKLPQGIRL